MNFSPNGEHFSYVNTVELLNEPRGISLDSQGNIIVCDSGNKSVRYFSPDGKISRTIGLGSFQMPYDCLCHEDKIFVTDRDAHVIKVYTGVYNSHGRFLYEFGRFGTGDEELNEPTGLAVDKTGHLLLCQVIIECRFLHWMGSLSPCLVIVEESWDNLIGLRQYQ